MITTSLLIWACTSLPGAQPECVQQPSKHWFGATSSTQCKQWFDQRFDVKGIPGAQWVIADCRTETHELVAAK